MLTNFCEEIATLMQEIDVPVFIENLAYWIRKNAANEKHFHDGRYWSYNSYPAFAKLYPFWSEQKIRRIIKRALEADLIIIDNFNCKKYDNTNWYTLTDKALAFYPALHGLILNTPVETDSTPVETDRPIPKLQSTSNINITISDIVETYHEELPDLPKIRKVDSKMKGQLNKMVKDWPSYQKEGKPFTLDSFRDYLQLLKKHYSWFLKPYPTESGNQVKCTLRKLTREINITKIVNGEFSAS